MHSLAQSVIVYMQCGNVIGVGVYYTAAGKKVFLLIESGNRVHITSYERDKDNVREKKTVCKTPL